MTKGRELVEFGPRSAAISPDGRWLYLTCFAYQVQNGFYVFYRYLPAVVRVDLAGDAGPQLFAGSLNEDEAGPDDGHFTVPSSVACDAQGNVFVSDYMNDRVQVFDPDGKRLASVKAERPAQVLVHQRTGEIYVGSWIFDNDLLAKAGEQADKTGAELTIRPTLTRLGPFKDPQPRATYPLPWKATPRSGPARTAIRRWAGGNTASSWTRGPIRRPSGWSPGPRSRGKRPPFACWSRRMEN